MRRSSLIVALVLAAATALASTAPEDLFRPSREQAAFLSPDGTKLAVIVRNDDIQSIEVIDIADNARREVFSTEILKADETAITSISWVDNTSIMFSVYELVEGVAKLSDTRNIRRILFTSVTEPDNTIRYLQSRGLVLSALPNEPDRVLFAVSGSKSYVYKIQPSRLHAWGFRRTKTSKTDNGQITRTNRIAEIDGRAIRWVADINGVVRAVMRVAEGGKIEMMVRENAETEWSSLREWNLRAIGKRMAKAERRGTVEDIEDDPENRIYFPSAIIDGSDEFVIIAGKDDERAVFRYNYETGEKTTIYENPDAEIVDVSLSYDGQAVQEVIYYEDGAIRYFYPNSEYQSVQTTLSGKFPAYSVQVASADAAGQTFVANLSSSVQPGRILAYRVATDEAVTLYETNPWLNETELTPSSAASVTAADGVVIEYYLTQPEAAAPVPLVVYPHGGPVGVRDLRIYDPFVQHVVAAGYAVLQINFRGSSGFGGDFEESGRGQFGVEILADIESAIDAVTASASIDGSRICIVGRSYGGYAALMLPTRSPNRYRCSAAHAAPTDLGLLVAASPDGGRTSLREFLVGEVGDDEVYGTLKAQSPVYQAAGIDVPVLLSHGKTDKIVDLEHSLRMKLRLERRNANVDWLLFEEEGHSFSEVENSVAYSNRVIEFLGSHLQ
ncbi:MAG: prolyl oligopeptidase family serine peptidase [Pseudomonadota bacterium]